MFLDESVLDYSQDVLNKIRIGPVEGVLKETLQISVEANWENIFNIGGGLGSVIDNITRFSSLAGNPVGLLNTGIWSRKFYKGGSYLKINPKMRVVNWRGENNVLDDARTLTDLALPLYKGKTPSELIDTFSDVASNVFTDGVSIPSKASLKSDANKLFDTAASNSPKPVEVVISNFFRNTFIIESVQVEFSKEMTSQGPLYADFDVVLSTPEVTLRGGTGLKNIPKRFNRR